MNSTQVGANGSQSAASPQPQSRRGDGEYAELAAAMDALEQRTGIPFEVWIKQPRPQIVDEQGRRLLPVITPESLAQVAA